MKPGRVKVTPFGQSSRAEAVTAFRLELDNGVSATVTDLGASLIGFVVPDRSGTFADVALASASAELLEQSSAYFGAAIGRVAGRISQARFTLDGALHTLSPNEPPHHLHGGIGGMARRLWSSRIIPGTAPEVRFAMTSPDGEEGYPGTLDATLTYRLEPPAKLSIVFEASADAATPFNPTCHAYFNLGGHGAGSVGEHRLRLNASRYTPINEELIPLGSIDAVAGTPFDFTKERGLSPGVASQAGGYDQNFVIDAAPGSIRPAAVVRSLQSGRRLTVRTDRPCIHLYTGAALTEAHAKDGASYLPFAGFALETQGFPDALNHAAFPADTLRPGQRFISQTIFSFDQDNSE